MAMRASVQRLASAAATAAASSSAAQSMHADVVIVGGGTAGCLLAGRLALDNVTTVLLEAGDDVRQRPTWHWTLPCSQLAHRLARRGYESATTTTTPQRTFDEATSSSSDSSTRVPVHIPTPCVLGGHGVMGSRCWNTGDVRDWDGAPWSLTDDLLPRLRKFENCEAAGPHRGRHGTFTLCNAPTLSPYYRRVCEGFAPDVTVARELPRGDGHIPVCCGRVDVLVDRYSGCAHSTLRQYLLPALALRRPLQVLCNYTATHLLLPPTRADGAHAATTTTTTSARGVTVVAQTTRGGGGAERVLHVHAGTVIVCAGTIGSAQLLSRTRQQQQQGVHATSKQSSNNSSSSSTDNDARTFWDVPQVVLQYATRDHDSHNNLSDPLVRALLRGTLCLSSTPPSCLQSSWDDLVLYADTTTIATSPAATTASSTAAAGAAQGSSQTAATSAWRPQSSSSPHVEQRPDVQILFQPFTLDSDGTQPLLSSSRHGCQFVVRPLRPRSRGRVDADVIDPNYFAVEDDAAALRRGVALVKHLVATRSALRSFVGPLHAQRLESSGMNGGSCSSIVDARTFAVTDMAGAVYVCGSAVLPQPLSGSTLPYTMVLADKLADALLNKQRHARTYGAGTRSSSRSSGGAAADKGTSGGCDDRSTEQATRIVY